MIELEESFPLLGRMKNWKKEIHRDDEDLVVASVLDPELWKVGFFDEFSKPLKKLVLETLVSVPQEDIPSFVKKKVVGTI